MGLGLSGLELMSVEWGGRRGGNEFMAIRSDPYAGVACVACVCVCEGGGSAAFVVFVTHCGGRRHEAAHVPTGMGVSRPPVCDTPTRCEVCMCRKSRPSLAASYGYVTFKKSMSWPEFFFKSLKAQFVGFSTV